MARKTTAPTIEATSEDRQELLTPTEVAGILRLPIPTLYAWRYHSKGPPAVKIGRHLRYPAEGLRVWLQDRAEGERRA